MSLRILALSGLALALGGCTTTTTPTNPLQARWSGKPADTFFANYGPPIADAAAPGGATLYTWRGGFARGKSCTVQLKVSRDYKILSIQTLSDRPDPKGGPTHCERTLDAA
jgi:hypothetical protein